MIYYFNNKNNLKMAKFKYLRGGRVFESDKIYNLPRLGDGGLVLPDGKIRTSKPKYASGGEDPSDPKKRKLPKDVVYSHTEEIKRSGITPMVNIDENDPIIYDKNEFNKYYRTKAINALNPEDQTLFGTFASPADQDAFIASRGGTPDFAMYQKLVRDYEKSLIPKTSTLRAVAANSPVTQKLEGYRYNKGLPDTESITQYGKGGVVEYGVTTQTDRQGRKGKQYANGGIDTSPLSAGISDPLENFRKRKFNLNPQTATPQAEQNVNFGNILGSAAPFMDNFANLIATENTPNIPTPTYTQGPRLNTSININPQLRQINDQAIAANRGISQSTSSAGVANANKSKILSDKWRAVGDLNANKQNLESQLQNQASMADYQARRSNDALTNQANQQQMMRTDDINTRYASVVSDFGSDIANINREKNLMSRDKEAFKMLMKVNPDAIYQFADTDTFKTLYGNDEPGLRKLILTQRGSAQKATLAKLYKQLFNKDFTE